MFKPHYGFCPFCPAGNKVFIVVKAGYCNFHNASLKQAKKNKALSSPPAKKFRKKTGELDLYKIIWEERPHVSEVSGTPLGEFDVRYFSHILSKGSYGKFRLNKDNIMLKTPEEHHTWEFGDISHPMWDKAKEKKQLLKQRYYR